MRLLIKCSFITLRSLQFKEYYKIVVKYQLCNLKFMGSVLEILLAFLPTLMKHLDDAVQLSRLCYNYPVIQNYYTSRRQKCERSSRYSTSRAFKNHFRSYLYKKSKLSQNRIHYVIKKRIKGVEISVKYMNLSPALLF